MAAPQVLTAAEATMVSPLPPITNPNTVEQVQLALKEKGYTDGGEADGKVGKMMGDELLAFRARNGLPLVPVVDQQVIEALKTASPKEIPERQALATPEHVAERVEAVATIQQVKSASWWSKAWAVIAGVPSLILSLVLAAIDQFDEAMNALMPVKNTFSEIPVKYFFVGFVVMAGILGYQQVRIARLAAKSENDMVTGYKVGTVKNDIPAMNGGSNG